MKTETHRIFFAILPDSDALNDISLLQASHHSEKARFLPQEKIHLTLLFIGSVDNDLLECIKNAANKAKHQKFNLPFDKTGIFKRPRILWLGLEQPNPSINELHEKLKNQIEQCGITTEKRQFQAHITLARKFSGKDFNNPPAGINFYITHFYLMESVPIEGGVRYEILETYPLD